MTDRGSAEGRVLSRFWRWPPTWYECLGALVACGTVLWAAWALRMWLLAHWEAVLGAMGCGVVVGIVWWLLAVNRSLGHELATVRDEPDALREEGDRARQGLREAEARIGALEAERDEATRKLQELEGRQPAETPSPADKRAAVEQLQKRIEELRDLIEHAGRCGLEEATDGLRGRGGRFEAEMQDREWFEDPRRAYLASRQWWLEKEERQGAWPPGEMWDLYGNGPNCRAHGEHFDWGTPPKTQWLDELFGQHKALGDLLAEREEWTDGVLRAIEDGIARLRGRYAR